jgi:CRP/FNR family cyclic AMP-dependent transcriptional regulator
LAGDFVRILAEIIRNIMLESSPIFCNLNANEIAKLEAISHKRKVPKNSVVINEGDEGGCLYILASGRAVALRSDESGHQLVVNRFGPWDCFGEMSIFNGNSRCATVMTKEACTLITIQRKDFLSFAAEHPVVCWNVINALLAKLRRATRQIEDLAFTDAYGRLANFLVENQDPSGRVKESLTHQELADIIGSTRETICRISNELIAGGYISRHKDEIVILQDLPYRL